jgi:hypothetical protein
MTNPKLLQVIKDLHSMVKEVLGLVVILDARVKKLEDNQQLVDDNREQPI